MQYSTGQNRVSCERIPVSFRASDYWEWYERGPSQAVHYKCGCCNPTHTRERYVHTLSPERWIIYLMCSECHWTHRVRPEPEGNYFGTWILQFTSGTLCTFRGMGREIVFLCWYRIHEEFRSVYLLREHLPDQHPVCFIECWIHDELRWQLDIAFSKLMSWFEYNVKNKDGRQYVYK